MTRHSDDSLRASSDSAVDADPGDLVRRIEAGDTRAEDKLVARYRLGVEVILAQLTRDPALAQDIHQETFALVLTKLRAGELRDPKALPAFLRSVARNLLIANRRKEARYNRLDEDRQVHGPTRGPVQRHPSQLQRLLASEEAERVRLLLGELRFERDRGILVRYYLTGDSREDICRDLDLDPGLFNRSLYRARQRFRELWERSEKRLRLGIRRSREGRG